MPGVGAEVWVERRKYPDSQHYGTEGIVLGEDAHGVWVGARPGSRILLPDGGERIGARDCVWCLPRDDWFLLHLWDGHPELALYVDVCTPATWNQRGARTVDLDFDVVVWTEDRGGHVELVDEDEFEEHRVALGYPESLVAEARRAAEDLLGRVTRSEPPFDLAAAREWLEELRALTGA